VVVFYASPPPATYTLSLHDALPISGTRRIPHTRWFQGFMMNGTEPDEVVVETRFKSPRTHGALTEYARRRGDFAIVAAAVAFDRSEEHTSELQSRFDLVCRLLLEKK